MENTKIVLRVDNIFIDIIGDLEDSHKKQIERKLSFRPEGYQYNPHFNRFFYDKNGNKARRVWDGWKKQFWSGKKRTYFPTGLFSLVADYFKDNNIPYTVENHRVIPSQDFGDLSFANQVDVRDYQDEAISAACKKQRGIIRIPTGGGKTITAAGIIERLKVAPCLFFVTSIDLLTQAKESFEKFLRYRGENIKIGQIGGGVIDIQDINVCTIQTAVRALGHEWDSKTKFDSDDTEDLTPVEKYRDDICNLIRTTKLAICDEVQHWRADTCQLVCRELRSAYYTFGQSATPHRDQGDDMLIQACFGRMIYDISASDLIKNGWLVRPDIKIIHIKNRKSDFRQWQAIYKDRVVECEYYNGIVANIVNSYIEAGRSVLVLTQQVQHGKDLADMINGAQFLSGNSPKEHRERGLNNLRNGYIKSIVSTVIFDEGINVESLDCVVLVGQGKSKVRAMQRIGRVTRPYTSPDGKKKTKATAIDFCIHDKYLLEHAKQREKMYRTEPEYSIEHINDV